MQREFGAFQGELSDILSILGLDEEDLDWQDLAVCQGMDTSDFYENYEADPEFAKVIDEACLSCPVMRECLEAGMRNGEYGCWGSIYLTAGRKDHNRNSHKTPEVWERVRERLSG